MPITAQIREGQTTYTTRLSRVLPEALAQSIDDEQSAAGESFVQAYPQALRSSIWVLRRQLQRTADGDFICDIFWEGNMNQELPAANAEVDGQGVEHDTLPPSTASRKPRPDSTRHREVKSEEFYLFLRKRFQIEDPEVPMEWKKEKKVGPMLERHLFLLDKLENTVTRPQEPA